MTQPTRVRKKLIEVALPLEAINIASAREKSIRHGHPSTLHLWWARRPLAAARAVIFAQMVDDPSVYVDTLLGEPLTKRAAQRELKKRQELWEKRNAAFNAATGSEVVAVPEPGARPTLEDCAADIERERLFRIMEELVKWESTTNEVVLERARAEIWQSWRRTCAANADHPRAKELFDRNKLPAFHDPFAGGGALPLEAQRLGLESYATDLNPVAVLINKAMIEVPPKFLGKPAVNPAARDEAKHGELRGWQGAQGLAEDVRYYGRWMREEAEKRIGHLYPKIEITAEMAAARPDLKPLVGSMLTVVAWLWARTVKSPNPAFAHLDVPLVSSFVLSPMAGKEASVEPIIRRDSYSFAVVVGKPTEPERTKLGTSAGKRAAFRCLMSDVPISYDYIRTEGKAGRMGARLMAIVAEGDRGRVYLSPTDEAEAVAHSAVPTWRPDVNLPINPRDFKTPNYGLDTFADLFTSRQLVALTTFSDLVREARERVQRDAQSAGLPDDNGSLAEGGVGAPAYADAVSIYLGFLISKLADKGSTLCTWDAGPSSNKTASGRSARVATVRVTFGRQALPMAWDFAEVNFFSDSVGSTDTVLRTLCVPLDYFSRSARGGYSQQADAQSQTVSDSKVISTDPPYYDNIGYADLSDFFYLWLRRTLQPVFPELFSTLAVPKEQELVATPYRHGSREKAESFFLEGMTQAMHRLAKQAHPAFPTTIYYAFKQSETDGADGTASTGWETFLDAAIRAGFELTGTWPIRTELANRMIGAGSNALASSIVLVCRPRPATAVTATRREFLNALKAELPTALAHLQRGNIAPVDLAQASIGPGMAVYTRYAKVVDAEGNSVTVREALALINQTLDEVLAEQEGDFDADSRWAVAWFEQMGFDEGEFGVADVLARAKVTAVSSLADDGIVLSKGGKVRLLKPSELPLNWDPANDKRLTVWGMVHQLIRVLETSGETAAGELVAKLGVKAEIARELAYRLYTVCERKKRAQEALAYNGLVQSWPEISRLARDSESAGMASEPAQIDIFGRA
jgi:putative DNA methylase